MFSYTINDLRKISCLDRFVTVVYHDKREVQGILKAVGTEQINIEDSQTGLEISIPNIDIEKIDFKGYSSTQNHNHRSMTKFKQNFDKISNDTNITFARLFSAEIMAFAEQCESIDMKKYLNSELDGKAARFSVSEYEWYYECFLSEKKRITDKKRECNIIQTMLLFRMRQFDKAFSFAFELMNHEDILVVSLILVCLSAQMKNPMESLFWLDIFFHNNNSAELFSDSAWWYYLRMSCKYAAFDSLLPLLKKIAVFDVMLSIQSLAYLLIANNSTGLAMQLLDSADQSLSADTAVEIIERNFGYLVSDPDNNYHRFLRCISTIIQNKCITFYSDGDDISGYVYDYVPDREFGFILGFDMLVYFFRKESIVSENVNKHIKNNICSFSSVKDEELVMVTFKRSTETKRSYCAIEIV